ncbi:MAG TPA: endonuclease III domain-containing protein, partial [Deltaproteobacteria bacterium]|nr:endonuclease III domain-containing protein [Deltaproteobacteria bacterium]
MNKLVSSPVSGLQDLYSILSRHYGPSGWWPGESALEIMVGAVLTQNTAWSNVEKAIDNLKKAGALAVDTLHGMDQDTLAQLIRPSGYYNIKAQRLKNLISLVMDTSGGDIDSFLDLGLE